MNDERLAYKTNSKKNKRKERVKARCKNRNKLFEEKIGYHFKDENLLIKALTHSSFCRENDLDPTESYERLEFLGDAYLDAIMGLELYNRLGKDSEGKLSKIRATIVCENTLAVVGNSFEVGKYLNLGRGEEHNGGRYRESIIADTVEAIIGAIILDSGYEVAKEFVLKAFEQLITDGLEGKLYKDYKTQVQEILQKDGTAPEIRYVLDKEEGPDHSKTFFVHLMCNNEKLGSGKGRSKKEAEQNAAKDTLDGGYI